MNGEKMDKKRPQTRLHSASPARALLDQTGLQDIIGCMVDRHPAAGTERYYATAAGAVVGQEGEVAAICFRRSVKTTLVRQSV